MLFLVFNSAIRNPKSSFGWANFFMDDTIFLKCQKSSLTPCPFSFAPKVLADGQLFHHSSIPSFHLLLFKFSSSAGSFGKAGGAGAALCLYHGKSFLELIPHGLLQGEVPLGVDGQAVGVETGLGK